MVNRMRYVVLSLELRCNFRSGRHAFAGKVGCWHVEMGVKTTDMCLLGRHVANMSANMSADMLADMLATRHKKLSERVPLVSGRHVTC
jgi:hypothetical protein